jgi:uncharacterized SAM-binding protein YcdF (DUF218 family)
MFLTGGCGSEPFPQSAAYTDAQGEQAPPSSSHTGATKKNPHSGVAKKAKSASPSRKSPTQATQPEAIFVLGGATKREHFAARFAQQHPKLPIWVSSGSPEAYAQRVFAKAGIKKSRVHLDYQAVDTVTNFTTLVDQFQAEGIRSIYLITSDDHMRRARVIGDIVFGSRGIAIKPVPVPSGRAPEPTEKCLRDGARALLWLSTAPGGAIVSPGADMTKDSQGNYSSVLHACYR